MQTTTHQLAEIISGGQTGADRAALDAAISLGIPHGGWCPCGRRAEDGTIPEIYQLRETESFSYLIRTERNVIDSDATVIFTLSGLQGGSARTAEFARQHRRPFLHIELEGAHPTLIAAVLRDFITKHRIRRLNIAGSRESTEPGIYQRVREVVEQGAKRT